MHIRRIGTAANHRAHIYFWGEVLIWPVWFLLTMISGNAVMVSKAVLSWLDSMLTL